MARDEAIGRGNGFVASCYEARAATCSTALAPLAP